MVDVLDEPMHKGKQEVRHFGGKSSQKWKHIIGVWNVSQLDCGSRGQLRKLSNHAPRLVASLALDAVMTAKMAGRGKHQLSRGG